MNISKEEKRMEALARLNLMTKRFNLNPHIMDYFMDGKLYYSYLTCMGLIGSIDTIQYHPEYAQAAKALEHQMDCLVYHAVEFEDTLALLFVSDYRSDWEGERLQGTSVLAYVYNFSDPDLSEIGYISVDSVQGALIRVG